MGFTVWDLILLLSGGSVKNITLYVVCLKFKLYIVLQVLIVETPGLGPKVFFTTPLSLFQWFVCILAGLGSLVCYQLVLFIPICAKEEKTVTVILNNSPLLFSIVPAPIRAVPQI